MEPRNKYFGTPLSEWIERIPNELEVDAVGLWQVIPCGRDDFGLSGDALEDFACKCIVALVNRGAMPVKASARAGVSWDIQHQYGITADQIASSIILEWKRSGVDPDMDGIWFALPGSRVS